MKIRWFATFSVALAACSAMAQGLQRESGSPPEIKYGSVLETLDALKAMPGVMVLVTQPDKWAIVTVDREEFWAFNPQGHYAFPAVMRLALSLRSNGDLEIAMSSLCHATPEACDRLVEDFTRPDQRILEIVQEHFRKRK